jgi:hypothetical protein
MFIEKLFGPRNEADNGGGTDANGTPAPAPAPAASPAPAPAPSPSETPAADDKASKADIDKALKELNDTKAQLAKYKEKEQAEEDAKKTSEQKLAEEKAAREKVERQNLVLKTAVKKGLDVDLVDRVKGDTEAEITADIDLLLEKFGKPEAATVNAKGGKTQAGGKGDEDNKPNPNPGSYAAKITDYMAQRQQALAQK